MQERWWEDDDIVDQPQSQNFWEADEVVPNAPKKSIMKTALDAGERFRSSIDEDLADRYERGQPGFNAAPDASDEDKHKAAILNQYYREAGFEGIGVGQFDDPENIRARRDWALDQYEKNDGKPITPIKMSRGEAFARSMVDSTLRFPVIGDIATAGIDAVAGDYIEGGAKDQLRTIKKEAREDHPVSSMGGDIAAYIAPGAQIFSGGTKLLQGVSSRALPQTVTRALTPTGNSTLARAGRYVPQTVLPATIAGGADYALYEATIGANNIEADTGEAMPFVDRAQRGMEYLNPLEHPEGYVAGAAASPVYRLLRGGTTATINSVEQSLKAGKPTIAKGSFTPQSRQQQVDKQSL
ncbi:MAG: hypothetical protein AAFP81_19385, partial [Pseudomonadota bacterium]